MRIASRLAAMAALVPVAASWATAADFPGWRGPSRNGVAREKGLLRQWPQGGPRLLWQAKDVGYGFGSPAVVGQRAYLISSKGTEPEDVQALDAATGKPLWQAPIGKEGNPNQMPNYPGARSTPIVDGKLIYALGSDGDLVCLETAEGKMRWRKSLRVDFGGKPGVWAYAESPLIDGDKLICAPGGADATMVALDKRTGALIWKCAVPGGDAAGYASTCTAMVNGKRQYVQFLAGGAVGVDAATGAFLWRFARPASQGNASDPLVSGGRVYAGSGMAGGGQATLAPRGDGAYDAQQSYFDRALPNGMGGFILIDDCLYGAGNMGLFCIEWLTGQVRWRDRSVGPGSLLLADGMLYLHGEKGDVALIEPSPEGYREKGRLTPPDQPERRRTQAWSYPAIANGKLYIRDLERLWCYSVKGAR